MGVGRVRFTDRDPAMPLASVKSSMKRLASHMEIDETYLPLLDVLRAIPAAPPAIPNAPQSNLLLCERKKTILLGLLCYLRTFYEQGICLGIFAEHDIFVSPAKDMSVKVNKCEFIECNTSNMQNDFKSLHRVVMCFGQQNQLPVDLHHFLEAIKIRVCHHIYLLYPVCVWSDDDILRLIYSLANLEKRRQPPNAQQSKQLSLAIQKYTKVTHWTSVQIPSCCQHLSSLPIKRTKTFAVSMRNAHSHAPSKQVQDQLVTEIRIVYTELLCELVHALLRFNIRVLKGFTLAEAGGALDPSRIGITSFIKASKA